MSKDKPLWLEARTHGHPGPASTIALHQRRQVAFCAQEFIEWQIRELNKVLFRRFPWERRARFIRMKRFSRRDIAGQFSLDRTVSVP